MRFRSTFLDRRGYQALPAGEVNGAEGGEAGASSESWYADLIGGGPDVNPELSGSRKFDVFDEMAMTDPTIKALLLFQALPTRSAVWSLEPRVDEPVARAIADFVAWNLGLEGELGEMDLSWSGALGLTITAGLKHGPSIEELIWDDVRTWHDADGDPHLVRPLARLAPRPARTIAKVSRTKGRVEWVSQTIPGARPMPAEKVSYIVFDPDETGRWEGSSMLRPAWAAWRMKKALQIAAGIGWDRYASGLPVIFHPDNEDAETRARRIGEQIRQHERAFVNFPSNGMGPGGRPDSGWFLELVNGAATLADPVPLLRWFTEQESEAGLAMFSRLGSTDTGSRAVGEVQIDPFYLSVTAMANMVARERERQVIRRIVEVNFGLEAAERFTPKLLVTRIQARNVEVIARAISYLSPAGFTFTDRGAQDDVREMLGFGKLEDAAEVAGITPEALRAVLTDAGIDQATLEEIIGALPADVGIARNRAPGEGQGLLAPAPARRALPPARSNAQRDRELEAEREKRESLEERLAELERRPSIVVEAPPPAPVIPPAAPIPPAPVEVRFEAGAFQIETHVEPGEAPKPPTVIVEGRQPTGATTHRNDDGTVTVRYSFSDE